MSEEEVEDDGMVEEIDFDDVEDEVDSPKKGGKGPDSFSSIIADFFVGVNYKLILMLFLIYVFLMSDMFIDKVLSRLDGAVSERRNLTSKGALINGVVLVLLYMTADMLINNKIV